MAYHQAHLLMLAGYSSFFVSGLVLPKSEYPHYHHDHHDQYDVAMTEDEVDPSSVVPQEMDEAPASRCESSAMSSSPSASKAAPNPSAGNAEKRRKRSLFADQSHVRTISRWLCETQPHCQAAEDRPRQHSMPDISTPLRELHETKRFCGGGRRRPRLPSIQTTGHNLLAA